MVSGDTFGGDTFGGDTFGGDSLDPGTVGGDTFGGDTFGGDTFGGDTFGGDTFGGDTFGGDTFGGDTFGGDTFGGDTFGGDTFGGRELDSTTNRGMGRADTRTFNACILGSKKPGQNHVACTGPWYDNEGNRYATQPSDDPLDPLNPFNHNIYLTWFEPTSEPVDFYTVTRTGGGNTTVYTLQAEDLTDGWRPR